MRIAGTVADEKRSFGRSFPWNSGVNNPMMYIYKCVGVYVLHFSTNALSICKHAYIFHNDATSFMIYFHVYLQEEAWKHGIFSKPDA